MKWRAVAVAALLALLATSPPSPPGRAWPQSSPGTFVLSLASAIQRAHDISPSLELARIKVEKARLDHDRAASLAGRIPEDAVTSYEIASIKHLYPLQARQSLELAELNLTATYRNVELQVRTAYLRSLLARELVRLAGQAMERAQDHVRLAQKLFDAGTVPYKDVMDARVREADTRASYITAEKNLSLALMALCRVIGLPLDARLELEPLVPLLDISGYDMEQHTKQALERRYEMHQALAMTELTRRNLELALAYPSRPSLPGLPVDWPDFDFDGIPWWPPGLPNPGEGDETPDQSEQYNIPAARLDYQQAVIYYLLTKDEITFQVRQAHLNVAEAKERLAVYDESLQAAREGVRLAGLRYEAGAGTNLEVLAANLALSQAQTAYIAALFEYEIAKAGYVHAGSAGSRQDLGR